MLKGKTGVVTGASRGMGSHFVAALVAQGAQVAALARPSPKLEALAARHGDAVLVLPCDVRDPAQVNTAIATAAKHFGAIDFLVNNAAIFHPFLLEEARDAQVNDHIAINLAGPIWCTRAAIPHLRKSQGHIVSISSESVRMPYPFLSLYAATKGGLESLMAALREELREDGIRVTTLRSGSVEGSSGGKDWDPATTQRFYNTITRTGHAAFSGQPARPQSMAEALVRLLSMPSDVNVDFIEVRASHVGSPAPR